MINFKKSAAILLLSTLILKAFGQQVQVPEGYYDNAVGLSGAELKTALSKIINSGTRLEYGSGAGSTWSGFEKTDCTPEGYVWDMYSNNKVKFPGNGQAAPGMNIEHSVAKSWWGKVKNFAYRDLYHLNPSNTQANSARSSYPLGIVNSGTTTGTIKVGKNCYGSEYTGTSFEPLDEYKGDFARAYLYMFTCYENLTWQGNSEGMLKSGTYPMLRDWAAKMLIEWIHDDPVSEKEVNRSNAIYQIQGNRNPFIDYPELADYLWGEYKGQPFFFAESTLPAYLSPANNSEVELAEVHYLGTSSKEILVKTKNTTKPLSLSLSGENAGLFEIYPTYISAEDANEGVDVLVTFHPVMACEAECQFKIESEELPDRTVTLRAEATDQFSALAASEIKDNSFVANWTRSSLTESYILDVYRIETVHNSDVVVLDEEFDEGVPSGWSTSGYVDDKTEDSEIRLASSSSAGTMTTPSYSMAKDSKIQIRAKAWYSDENVNMTVKIGTETVKTFELMSDYETYTVTLSKDYSNSKVSISAASKKRLYIDNVKIVTDGTVSEEIRVEGYPKTVTGTTNSVVDALTPLTTYYYNVTPVYDGAETSQTVSVTTSESSALESADLKNVRVYSDANAVLIENGVGAEFYVSDMLGVKIAGGLIDSERFSFTLDYKGVIVIVVKSSNREESHKVILK